MADKNAAAILAGYLDPQDFWEHDGYPPLSSFLLWQLFVSYTETFLTEGAGGALKPVEPAGGIIPRVTPLEALAASRVLAEQLQRSRWWIAAEARKRGASWAEIGAALGMTKQAAWEGYRKYANAEPPESLGGLPGEYRLLAGESAES